MCRSKSEHGCTKANNFCYSVLFSWNNTNPEAVFFVFLVLGIIYIAYNNDYNP